MESNGLTEKVMVPERFVVQETWEETKDTFTLRLKPTGEAPFVFQPGQFNMLYVFGQGEVPISISGDPAESGDLIHTIRAVGAVTGQLRKLEQGDALGLRGPFGRPWPVEKVKQRDLLIITGGIGLAPLRPVIYHVLRHREDYERVAVLYGARTPQDILYGRQLSEWRGRFDLQVRVTVDQGTKDWHGSIGVVTGLIPRANFDPAKTAAFVCGPEIMMRFTIQELMKAGVAAKDIYVSMERNMHCAAGFCGHCQYGPKFVCKDGPVFCFEEIQDLFYLKEI